jgi:MOSC domain-containing protein YiiM
MGIVVEIGISKNKGEKIKCVTKVEVIKGGGIVYDRKFMTNNDKKRQITLIENENINYFNNIAKTKIKPLDFRRNIVTRDVKLNDLLGKEFFIGKIKVKAHDLCRPCLYLEKLLNQKDFVKILLFKGGLRCEILCDGMINLNDKIVEIN